MKVEDTYDDGYEDEGEYANGDGDEDEEENGADGWREI